ncbi:hypothetical protein D3C78_1558480 [compost metagenome]
MSQAVVGQTQVLGNHPAFAVVLRQEGFQTFFLEVVEGHQRQDSMAQLGVFALVNSPKTLLIKSFSIFLDAQKNLGQVCIFKNP